MLRKLSGAYSGTSCLRVFDRLVRIRDQRWKAIPTIPGHVLSHFAEPMKWAV